MFATGLPRLGESFFTASSMVIAIPSGVQIFCWIATLWGRPLRFATPLLFVFGFIVNFVLGGLTGVMVASVPLDTQVHDTYFVVAHFHYVLIGGAVFPLLGAVYYWFPKITGRMLSETTGALEFLAGLHWLQRRLLPHAYSRPMGHATPGLHLSSRARVGTAQFRFKPARCFCIKLRYCCCGMCFVSAPPRWHRWRQSLGSRHPRVGNVLPPPPYNFALQPVVTNREPVWAERDWMPVVTGLRVDRRELVGTSVTYAQPETREVVPAPSIWPFLAAIATTVMLIGSIFTPWAVVWGTPPIAVTLIGWFWPKGERRMLIENPRRH